MLLVSGNLYFIDVNVFSHVRNEGATRHLHWKVSNSEIRYYYSGRTHQSCSVTVSSEPLASELVSLDCSKPFRMAASRAYAARS